MTPFGSGLSSTKSVLILIAIVLVVCIYFFKFQGQRNLSFSGYVVYENSTYNFLIVSASSSPLTGTLPSMVGFPATTDPDYQYISYAHYKGTFPNVGDKILVDVSINNNIATNPPYTFAIVATNINVLLDAQFNATITGLIQSIK